MHMLSFRRVRVAAPGRAEHSHGVGAWNVGIDAGLGPLGGRKSLNRQRESRIPRPAHSGGLAPPQARLLGYGRISPDLTKYSQTLPADSSGVSASESIRTSGLSGSSYGSDTPVKFLISPANAFL